MDRYLALSVMYLSLGLIMNSFTKNEIECKYQYNINEILQNVYFNDLFNAFLNSYFNILLDSIADQLQFVSKFFVLQLDCSVPEKSLLKIPNNEKVIKS